MNKYQYYVNNKPVTKKEMVKQLEQCCYRVTNTMQVGLIGVDMVELDKKKFNLNLRLICNPLYTCVIVGSTTFSRRKI